MVFILFLKLFKLELFSLFFIYLQQLFFLKRIFSSTFPVTLKTLEITSFIFKNCWVWIGSKKLFNPFPTAVRLIILDICAF